MIDLNLASLDTFNSLWFITSDVASDHCTLRCFMIFNEDHVIWTLGAQTITLRLDFGQTTSSCTCFSVCHTYPGILFCLHMPILPTKCLPLPTIMYKNRCLQVPILPTRVSQGVFYQSLQVPILPAGLSQGVFYQCLQVPILPTGVSQGVFYQCLQVPILPTGVVTGVFYKCLQVPILPIGVVTAGCSTSTGTCRHM